MRNDKISKPTVGRYFPMDWIELATHINTLAFSVHTYYKRLPLVMENCTVECDRGYQLGSFFYMGYLAVFSLPVLVPPVLARRALERALQEFSAIDRGPRISVRDQQFVLYRAFLGPLGLLSVTQHVVNGGHRSCLKYRTASQLSKANRTCKGQIELLSVRVA